MVKAEEIIGAVLMILGFFGMLYNWMTSATSETIMQQQYFALKIIANWLMIIAGILIAIMGTLSNKVEPEKRQKEIVWTCDYCKKEFDKKEECQKHEKECKKNKK